MNKFFATFSITLFALVAVGSASAGDFSGFYFGGNVGAARGVSRAKTTTVFSPTGYFATSSVPAIAAVGAQKLTPAGITGGGQAGYNFQSGHFVIGAEADIQTIDFSVNQVGFGVYPCCAPTSFTVAQSISADWMFTVRPRVGAAFGPVLFYGTTGIAFTSTDYKETFNDTFATAHESAAKSENRTGWTGGGGVEVRVSHHISVKGEYLHADFGSMTKTTSTNLTAFTPPISFPTNVFTHTSDLTANIGRAGINFRF